MPHLIDTLDASIFILPVLLAGLTLPVLLRIGFHR